MLDLELLGPDADGSHVTLADAEGRRYRLAVDDALRAVVRPARRPVGVPRPGTGGSGAPGGSGGRGVPALRPKEIQGLLRAGVPVEEVAERAGIDVSRAESYAIPVDAERAHVAGRARDLRVGHVSDAPNLGDLVVDRLAQRQVDPASIAWDAVRRETEPWEVVVTFVAAGRTREARWRVDLARHVLTATDDESRWLSETDMGAASRRHLNAVDAIARGPRRTSAPPPAYDAPDDTQVDAAGPTDTAGTRDTAGTAAEPAPRRDAGEELLDQLAASRGTRQELADPEDDEFEDDLDGGFDEGDADEVAGEPDRALVDGDDPWGGELPGAHPAESHPDDAPDAAILALPAPTVTEEVAPVADPEPAPTPAPASASRSEAKSEPQSEPQPDREPESEPEPALEPHDTAEDHPTLDVPVPAAKPAAKARRKSSRRSVPSWDEIVFGTRSD